MYIMLKRYIGHQSPVSVVLGGEDFGYVETGDSIAVPDDLANTLSWPEDNWADGAAKAKAKPSTAAKSDNKNDEKSGE
jgi:hypothetical protein